MRDLSLWTARDLLGHTQRVHCVRWQPAGRRLASGSVDRTARIWSVDSNFSKEVDLSGHKGTVEQVCWNPAHADQLATVSNDNTVRLWDLRAGGTFSVRTVATKESNINAAWSPDGKHLVVGDKTDCLMMIDVATAKVVRRMEHDYEINEFSISPSGTLFFTTLGTGNLEIRRYPSLEPLYKVQVHASNVYVLDQDPLGRYIATGGADANINLIDSMEFCPVRSIRRFDAPIRGLGFSFDGQLLASGSEEPRIDIADVATGELVHSIESKAATSSLHWHPSRHILAYAGEETVEAHPGGRGVASGVVHLFMAPQL